MTNRILIAFTSAFVSVLLLMFAYSALSSAQTAFPALQTIELLGYVFLAATVLCTVLAIRAHRLKTVSRGPVNVRLLAIFMGGAALSCFAIAFLDYILVIKLLYAVIPGAAVLYLVRLIYPRELFVSTAVAAPAALLIWLAGPHAGLRARAVLLGAAILCAAMLALMLYLRTKDGVLPFMGRSARILPVGSGYGIPILSAGLCAVLSLAAAFVSGAFVIYFAYVLLGYIFALAVYYTVRLM